MEQNKKKKALIAVNLTGFMSFILDDIDILNGMGFDVTIAADNRFGEDEIRGEISRRGAHFVDIRMDTKNPFRKINKDCFLAYRRLIKQEKFDAIICHTPITGLIVRMAAIGSSAKIIYVSHGLSWTHLSDRKTRLKFRAFELLSSYFCDAIVTINEEDHLEAKRLGCRKVFKINGVGCRTEKYSNITIDRKAYREAIGIDDDKIMVLAVGELSDRKNHMIVAKALASLPDKQRFSFVIAGRDLASTGIGSKIKDFCDVNDVDLHILGFRTDIPQLMHCSDIGVMPSVREGLGMAGIQQLCAGVPMVGTDVQGVREYVRNGITGITVDSPYNIQGFADAIHRLSDSDLRASMADDCRRVAEEFNLEQSVVQRRRIYLDIFG